MGKIVHLAAGEGKMELWSHTGGRGFGKLVLASSDPKELAKAFLKHGCEETMSTSSSFDFGRESGFRTNDAVHKLFDRTFKIINKS